MAKIILAMNNVVMREISLLKERTTIGRSPHNDIVIDDRAISAEHAVIVTVDKDAFLEDLNSTNGTQVNGQPIKKHFLQENDIIELAQFRATYVSCATPGDHVPAPRLIESVFARGSSGVGVIKVLNGANTGKETVLSKSLTTIGRPGLQVAVISRRSNGYCLTHVEGKAYPLVNGVSINPGRHFIVHGDVIELSGVKMQFLVE
ncbi:FHA domain-containing protein [Herbaspirillum sp. ST 5-3]|uniref:FHA domain-containing protein n=1 Tax=Oxalobacteraceae TaxID=75682 RepID=UPI0010A2D20F|nr:FHA domain-containing protein [Herbaspirillum sp. ST 5-3]